MNREDLLTPAVTATATAHHANAPHNGNAAPRVTEKLAELRRHLAGMGSVLVCYSGGIDSAFVLAVAHEVLRERAIGMTAVSPSLAPFEREEAVAVARQIGARHELVESREIDDPSYVANHTDCCFHGKSELYRLSAEKQKDWSIQEHGS